MLNNTRTEKEISFNCFIACDRLPSYENSSHANETYFALTAFNNGQFQSQILTNPSINEIDEILKSLNEDYDKIMLIYHPAQFDVKHFKIDNIEQVISIDIQFLAQILIPLLNNHSLTSLVNYFEIKTNCEDDNFENSKLIAEVFLNLQDLAFKLTNKPLKIINKLLVNSTHPIKYFFEFIYNQPKCRKSGSINGINYPVNIMGKPIQLNGDPLKKKDVTNRVQHFFEPDGLLASQFELYEPRRDQQKMAEAILNCLSRDELFIVEAGTGIGKTLAYLVPTLYYLFNHPASKVIISTHTKTLQEQLFYKEIPLLQQLISDNFLIVLLKGRGNYICLKRFFTLLDYSEQALTDDQRLQLLTLIPWLHSTRTGDIEENNGFSSLTSKSVWSLINAAENNCARGQCDYESNCYLQKIRKAAKIANIVIVNHSLLFSNIAQQNSILGEIKTLIVDEAHHIEKSASQYLGESISRLQLLDIAHWIFQNHPYESGIVPTMQIAINKSSLDDKDAAEVQNYITDLKHLSFELINASLHYFKALGESVAESFKKNDSQFKLRLTAENSPFQQNMDVYFPLRSTFQSLYQIIDSLKSIYQSHVSQFSTQYEFALDDLVTMGDRLRLWQMTLESFFDLDPEIVYWCQQSYIQRNVEYQFHAVPIDLASTLADQLFSNLKRAILTSATLTVNETFDYLKSRWGLHFLSEDIVKTQTFLSPFLYQEQMQFLIANYLAHPKTDDYILDVSQCITSILNTLNRNTLILFTSYHMLKKVYGSVKENIENNKTVLLAQGIHGSRSSLLEKFRSSQGAVLFGTSSFWEGIDIPGSSLECVIITRLPFDVPTDPVVEARVQKIEENSGNAFFQYTVPEALVKFRQGIGRLIRSGQDIGSMIVLDNRIVSTQYGRLFLNALPSDPIICGSDEEILINLNKWF